MLKKRLSSLPLPPLPPPPYRRFSHRSPCRFPPVCAQYAQQYSFCSSVKSAGGFECFLKAQHLHFVRTVKLTSTSLGASFLIPRRRSASSSSSSKTSRSPHWAPRFWALKKYWKSMLALYGHLQADAFQFFREPLSGERPARAGPIKNEQFIILCNRNLNPYLENKCNDSTYLSSCQR